MLLCKFTRRKSLFVFSAVLCLLAGAGQAGADAIIKWDFTTGTHGWIGNQMVESLEVTPRGLVVEAVGNDPWIEGPPVDLPGSGLTRVTIRMKSEFDQNAVMFYGRGFVAGRFVPFKVRAGQWRDYSLIVNAPLGKRTRFRIDPSTRDATVVIKSVTVETIGEIKLPKFERPERPAGNKPRASVQSGTLSYEQRTTRWGGFAIELAGREMAAGYSSEVIGIMLGDEVQWLNLQDTSAKIEQNGTESVVTATLTDRQGGEWKLVKSIMPGRVKGSIAVEVQINADADRKVVHLPWLTMFPGLGTFGRSKYQGVLPGLEYLCDEPSSSEADIAAPNHIRRTPDPVKITFPMMAVSHGRDYIGLVWEPSEMIAATFDSPDRVYDSGAHLMALSAPAVGALRFENEFAAHAPFEIKAGESVKAAFTIIGGRGRTIIPAVQQYLKLNPLPALPEFEGGFYGAVNLLGYGWLDSRINENGLFRHAVWGDNFRAGPAADACMYIDYLANQTRDSVLAARLERLTDLGLSKVNEGDPYTSAISHARLYSAPFVFGRTREFLEWARNSAFSQLSGFDAGGIKHYKPQNVDYGRTHFADHANGLGGRSLVAVLEGAALSGDDELIERAWDLLDKQTAAYANTVPRGAQTWEVPLHTPDILASAHMVKAYTLGYIISGEQRYLEQARYWAWTGVPFVYLDKPVDGPIGSYATIAVLGATNWQAPVWFGQPVQWCGLVYASALQLLAEYDDSGPWKQLADGITIAGLQMTWPRSDKDRVGLLPDYFLLRPQVSDGPAINPGTVQAHLPEAYGRGKLYDLKKLPRSGFFIHAPCRIDDIEETDSSAAFTLDGWGDKSYHCVISGVKRNPRQITGTEESRYHADRGWLILELKGRTRIELSK